MAKPKSGTQQHCRVCQGPLFPDPLLYYAEMPASAQGFLSQAELGTEQGQGIRVVQCVACGLVQLDGEPVPYYREVIRAAAYSPEMRQFRLDQFLAWAKQYQLLGKPVLEIGCGKGEYLELLREVGLNASGIEYSQAHVDACLAQGLPATCRYLGEHNTATQPSGLFEGFVCLSFMEHWPAPKTALADLWASLAEGAVGLIEVPNFDMIVHEGQFAEFIADHLLYFTEQTLRSTLEQNGFDVLQVSVVWHGYILSAEVRKRQPLTLDLLHQRRTELTKQLKDYLTRYRRVAIWGAGHQALALISLTCIAKDICYVIDSAPFKQGKFTPASHLPIVSPQHLFTDRPDAVLVMAASYSDEVCSQLKSMNIGCAIAVLREQQVVEVPT
ncbi:MAG: hypothetical protein RIR18_2181 [Pseudomonadota bacterium]|jgi:SAM-dependent methyltransferase